MKEIKKSLIAGTNFEAEVARFVSLKKEWREHQVRVEVDEKNGVTGIAKHVACKSPIAPPLIEMAIDADGNPAYQIVDDGPTKDQILESKKIDLEHRLLVARNAAIEAVYPRRRAPALEINENDIVTAQAQRLADHQKKSILKSLVTSVPEIPAADQAFLDQQKHRRAQVDKIHRATSQSLSDIDGLTDDTIDSWKLPSFS